MHQASLKSLYIVLAAGKYLNFLLRFKFNSGSQFSQSDFTEVNLQFGNTM